MGTRRFVALTLVVFAMVAFAASAGSVHPVEPGDGGWRIDRSGDPAPANPPPEPAEPGNDEPNDPGVAGDIVSVLGQLVVVVAVLAGLVLIGRSGYRFLRSLRIEVPPDPDAWDQVPADAREEVGAAAATGLGIMRSEGPTGDVVIACWLTLEEAARRAGVGRAPSETASELTVRVLNRLDVPADAVHRLLDLYRTARYSGHAMGDADRQCAVVALGEIRAALAPAPSG